MTDRRKYNGVPEASEPPCAQCGRPLADHHPVIHTDMQGVTLAAFWVCPRNVYQPEP